MISEIPKSNKKTVKQILHDKFKSQNCLLKVFRKMSIRNGRKTATTFAQISRNGSPKERLAHKCHPMWWNMNFSVESGNTDSHIFNNKMMEWVQEGQIIIRNLSEGSGSKIGKWLERIMDSVQENASVHNVSEENFYAQLSSSLSRSRSM